MDTYCRNAPNSFPIWVLMAAAMRSLISIRSLSGVGSPRRHPVPDPPRLALHEGGQVLTQTTVEVKYRSASRCNSHKVQARTVQRVTLPTRSAAPIDVHHIAGARERAMESRPAGEVRELRSHHSSWPVACSPNLTSPMQQLVPTPTTWKQI